MGIDDIHGMAGHLVRRLHQHSTQVFHAAVKAAGIDITPVQFAALGAIAARPGLDQATVAALIAYDRATIGGVIDRLVAKGLVARETSPTDRRARVLHLTPAGEAAYAEALPVVRGCQADIVSGLPEAEREAFLRLLSRMVSPAG